MYLTKLLLKNFGKFHNTSMDLKPGINVIVGDKDSGKTTIREFLIGMMYGIPRRDGITSVRSEYEKYKPEDYNGYSGVAYIKQDGNSYLVERSFLAGARKTSVMEVKSGREVRLVNDNTLSGTLIDTDKNTYIDTKCITEDRDKSVTDYLTNMTLTGTSTIDKAKAIEYLKEERKKHVPRPLIRRLDELDEKLTAYEDVDDSIKQIEDEIKQLNEDFVIEAEKRKRVARRMVENADGTVTYENDDALDSKIDRITAADKSYGADESIIDDDDDEDTVKFTDRIPVIFGAGILVILIIAAIVYILPFEDVIRKLFIIFTALFVMFTIIDGFNAKGYFKSDSESETPDEKEFNRVLEELREESEEMEESEFDMSFAKEYQEKKTLLRQKENEQLERRAERNQLRSEFDKVFKKKSELEDEIKAIDFAINKINSLSDGYKKEAYEKLLGNISTLLPVLTRNRFRDIAFNETGDMEVVTAGGTYPVSELTDEDNLLIYMAVRLSIAGYLSDEKLPLIIDGTSAFEGAESIEALAECLIHMNEEQIIILTADRNLPLIIRNKGIEINTVQI